MRQRKWHGACCSPGRVPIAQRFDPAQQRCGGSHHREPDFAQPTPEIRAGMARLPIRGPRVHRVRRAGGGGHGCAACHVTRLTNGILTDDRIDLERYGAVSVAARFARALAEIASAGVIGASAQFAAVLAKHSRDADRLDRSVARSGAKWRAFRSTMGCP